MKRYETYKDSGILWLDAIPSHWHEEKLKHISTCNDEVLPEDTPDELIIHYVEISDVDSVSGINNHTDYTFANAPSRARRITRKNDVIISTVRTYLKAIATVKEDDLIVSTGFAVIRPTKVNQKYLAYSLLNDDFLGEVISKSVGVSYPAINATDLIEIKIPVPPREEQETIAAYLDHKVGQIDATLAEKEQMLEDLKNYRSAIISEAVTKGLDKNVEMKDSGIDKFPMIRSNWNTSKLKYIASIRSGSALPINNIKKDALYEVYGGNGCMGRTDEYNTESPAIIIGRVGALCGNVHLIKTKKWVTDNALILNIKRDVTYEYLYYYLTAYDLNTLNSSNAQPLITGTKVLDVVTPMPSLNEQIMIANYLDDKTSMIDKTIDQITVQIVELKSYKSTLITEAVTGKIDLRDWKPKEGSV